MSTSDVIQIAIPLVLLATLIAVSRSMVVQNRLFKAQLLRDRFDMYRWTLEPLTENHIKDLEAYPDDYMDRSKYENEYKDNDQGIRKYFICLICMNIWYLLPAYRDLGFLTRWGIIGLNSG